MSEPESVIEVAKARRMLSMGDALVAEFGDSQIAGTYFGNKWIIVEMKDDEVVHCTMLPTLFVAMLFEHQEGRGARVVVRTPPKPDPEGKYSQYE